MVSDLIVITTDDLEPAVRLRGGFEAAGATVELLTSGESLAEVPGTPVLLILTGHIRERRAQGLIRAARQVRVPIIGLVEETDRTSRDDCRQLGLTECIPKPIDVEEVVLIGRRLAERERLRTITGIIGRTEIMEEVLERVVQIASVDSTVLIQGESGTGKELVARGIHALSPRRHRAFIAVNIAALPDTLLESELFGHEKGAFTGASSLRKGLFELAHNGTIFLDEIGEMAMATQSKLLRVLEEREFRRVGGEETIRVDVRVIAATNRGLREEVQRGLFRRDLYHRINVLRIDLPSLRERREDIPLLIERFIDEFSRQHDRSFQGIDAEALQMLVDYAWPGNVRELRNLVESMVVLAPGRTIRPVDIPSEVRGGRGALLPVPIREVSRDGEGTSPPELEFILRSLFDMKLDLDDLRREFDAFRLRRSHGEDLPPYPILPSLPATVGITSRDLIDPSTYHDAGVAEPEIPGEEESPDGRVVYRSGMSMQDLERAAIGVALRDHRGNRRKAARALGIGERTLYRKIKDYGLDAP